MVEVQKAEIDADVEVQLMREKMKLEIQMPADHEKIMMEKIRQEEGNKLLYFTNLCGGGQDKEGRGTGNGCCCLIQWCALKTGMGFRARVLLLCFSKRTSRAD